MKSLGKILLIAVFVVPIVTCILVLKSIWSDDTVLDNKTSGDNDNIMVSVSDPIYESGEELISGDEVILPVSGEIREMGGESFETKIGDPISTIYTDATISSALANVYLEALESSEVVGKLEKHTVVVAQKFPNGWTRVSGTDTTGLKVSGWIRTDNVSFVEDGSTVLNPTSASTGVVTAEPYLNVRLNPTTNATILTTVPKGTTVTIEESVNGWHKITYNGVTGWVSASYVK